jgi:hypothetical protein
VLIGALSLGDQMAEPLTVPGGDVCQQILGQLTSRPFDAVFRYQKSS